MHPGDVASLAIVCSGEGFPALRYEESLQRSESLERQLEAMDRTLREALAGGDLPRLGFLVREMRPEAAARPWARLAAAVVYLGEGRLEEARAGLTALRSAFPPPPIEAAATALLALCAPGPGAEAPVQRALDRFYRSLSALAEQACQPEAVDREELEEDLDILREVLSADPAAKRLLDAAQTCLLCLAELADLEEALRGEAGSAGVHRLFVERARRLSGPLLESLRDTTATALIRPLRHAVRLRWRAVLSLVVAKTDP